MSFIQNQKSHLVVTSNIYLLVIKTYKVPADCKPVTPILAQSLGLLVF